MKKKIIGGLLVLVLVLAFISTVNKIKSVKGASSHLKEAGQINFKRPGFTLTGIDSKSYSTDQVKKPLVINFWASWCGPCRSEAPELVKLNKKYHDQVQIYAVNLTSSDTESGARSFVKEFGFDFPVLLDKDGKVAKLYDITGIPTSYFISGDGIIVDLTLGYGGKEMLDSKFKKLAEQNWP